MAWMVPVQMALQGTTWAGRFHCLKDLQQCCCCTTRESCWNCHDHQFAQRVPHSLALMELVQNVEATWEKEHHCLLVEESR
ncbi:hypothetical protein A7L11_18875 [Acinetobacter baumannii]|nr:hypothetical protein A7L11_18875 [Acinetobacter baumannii]